MEKIRIIILGNVRILLTKSVSKLRHRAAEDRKYSILPMAFENMPLDPLAMSSFYVKCPCEPKAAEKQPPCLERATIPFARTNRALVHKRI